jgi:hypothetical protein
MRDGDGYFWFVGRADDLIKTSGHLIGPFEVESALIEHEAVAEAGVIGVPDETAGEVVKAYVTLNPGFEPGPRTWNGDPRPRAQEARPRRRPARDRVPQDPAQDPLRQDHAPPSEGARAWPARRGHFHIGDRRDMTVIDKPRLDRAHVLDLLAHMIRIRRFEDKCAELYTQQKIRGFLHLYDGEEAIAAGSSRCWADRDRIVATYREHGQALVRGVPMTPSWPRCTARPRAVPAGAAGRCTCSTPRPSSTAAMPSSAAACRWPVGSRWPTGCAARTGHGLFLRRGRGGRGRVPRDAEPGGAVGPAGAVRLRKQRLRHGHGHRAL